MISLLRHTEGSKSNIPNIARTCRATYIYIQGQGMLLWTNYQLLKLGKIVTIPGVNADKVPLVARSACYILSAWKSRGFPL
jgi:hypothetical protein